MTRRRARNQTQGNGKNKTIFINLKQQYNNCTVIIRSQSYNTMSSGLNAYSEGETTIHPNYSLPNGGSIENTQNLSILGTSSSSSSYKYFVIKKVSYKILLENLDNLAKMVNFLPIPFQQAGQLGTSYTESVGNRFNCKTFTLSPKGETGATKTIQFSIEPYKVEGFKDFSSFVSNTYWWQLQATRGAQYTNLWMQVFNIDWVTAMSSGINFFYTADYEVQLLQTNVTLNA